MKTVQSWLVMIFLVILGLVSITLPWTAQAQQICAPRAALIEKLKTEFQEEPEAAGVTTSEGLFEVLVSESGTWTVLATGSNGISCLVLSGEGWTTRHNTKPSPTPTGKKRGA